MTVIVTGMWVRSKTGKFAGIQQVESVDGDLISLVDVRPRHPAWELEAVQVVLPITQEEALEWVRRVGWLLGATQPGSREWVVLGSEGDIIGKGTSIVDAVVNARGF